MAIAFDSKSESRVNSSTFGITSHTCTGTDLDGILILCMMADGGTAATFDIFSATYNSIPMTRVASCDFSATGVLNSAAAIFILENPPSGTAFVATSKTGPGAYWRQHIVSFTGVETGGGYTVSTNTGDGSLTYPNIDITTIVDNCVVVDVADHSLKNSAFTLGSGQTLLNEGSAGTGFVSWGVNSYEAIATASTATQEHTPSVGNGEWSMCAISLRPAKGRPIFTGLDTLTFS